MNKSPVLTREEFEALGIEIAGDVLMYSSKLTNGVIYSSDNAKFKNMEDGLSCSSFVSKKLFDLSATKYKSDDVNNGLGTATYLNVLVKNNDEYADIVSISDKEWTAIYGKSKDGFAWADFNHKNGGVDLAKHAEYKSLEEEGYFWNKPK